MRSRFTIHQVTIAQSSDLAVTRGAHLFTPDPYQVNMPSEDSQ
jgi:hypothetical protein